MATIKIICHFLESLEINKAVGKPISRDKIAVAPAMSKEFKITLTNIGSVARLKLSKFIGVVTPPKRPAVKTDINNIEITGIAANSVKKIRPGDAQAQPRWREFSLPPFLTNRLPN
jgi:hypothetical protein